MTPPYRIVPHDRYFRIYKGDELIGTEVYLKGAKRILDEFKALSPGVETEPYQRPRNHASRVEESRTGIYDSVKHR